MKIGVVLVTFNRLGCLKVALNKYEEQTKTPEYLIVVNNASSDGTKEYLDEWKQNPSTYEKHVIHMEKNLGGSGGFYTGEAQAIKLQADYIWHADDDAYPDKYALENIEKCYQSYFENKNVAAFCASIKNVENGKDISWWSRMKKGVFKINWIPVSKFEQQKPFFYIDKFMYLGCVLNKKALIEVGLTDKDLFIHEDDSDHSIRLRKWGVLVAVPSAKVFHPKWPNGTNVKTIDWKYYYTIRNRIGVAKANFSLRYWIFETIKAILRLMLHMVKKYPLVILKMEKDAIFDALKGNKGINEKYLPNKFRC